MLPTFIENIFMTFNGFLKEGKDLGLYSKPNDDVSQMSVHFNLAPNTSEIFYIRADLAPAEIETITKNDKSACKITIEHTFGKEELEFTI